MDGGASVDSVSVDPEDHEVPFCSQLQLPASSTRNSSPIRSAFKRKRKSGQIYRSLVSFNEFKRTRKPVARRVSVARNPACAMRLQRWKKKIDRKYEKTVKKRMRHLLKLRRENQELKAFRLRFIEKCEALTQSTRAFRIAAEHQQMMTILSVVIYGGSIT